jgi:hypothetical protein
MGFTYAGASEDSFFESLLKSMLASGGNAAIQGAVSGGLQNYFDNLKADRLREEAGNQKSVEDLAASNERTIAPTMGPLEWAKQAKLNRSNPEMIAEATPDWSGDKGRLLPKDNKIWMGKQRVTPEPRAFLQILSNKLPMGPQDETAGFRGPLQPGQEAPSIDAPFEQGMKGTSISVASPLEEWADRNPGVAEWASEPAAKRAMDQKAFLGQLQGGAKLAQTQANIDSREKMGKAKLDQDNTLTRAKMGQDWQMHQDKMLKLQARIDAMGKSNRNSRTYLEAKLLADRAMAATQAAWIPEKQIFNPELKAQADKYMKDALDKLGGVDSSSATPAPNPGAGKPKAGPGAISAMRTQFPDIVQGMTDAQVAKGLEDGSLAARINGGS